MGEKVFISVLLPLPLPWQPVYSTDDPSVAVGERVLVPFSSRMETGVVTGIGVPPGMDLSKVKDVAMIDRSLERISPQELTLWSKIADYYLCTEGEVFKAAYPSLKTEDEAREVLRKERLAARLARREEMLAKARKDETRERYSAEIAELRAALSDAPEELPAPLKIELSPAQQAAAASIREGFASGKPVLLEGVTGSGKTEIYCSFAGDEVSAGRDVLFLVPEIGLTRQLEDRLRRVFGSRLLTFHSHETPLRRREVAAEVRQGGGRVVLGTRSALFLPFSSLGLVVVDEEQDSSYKQDSPAPRYNGRDTALLLASIFKAKVLLGSATPSLESLYNVETGRYVGVMLTQRYFTSPEPEIEIIDTTAEREKGGMVGSFSRKLIGAINETRREGGQVLILRARRGYSPSVQCPDCGWIAKCPRCSVPLIYHSGGRLLCHYCGHSERFTGLCPSCGGQLRLIGAGTQKVEDEAREIFPAENIARLDSDAAGEKKIIKDFSEGETGILIGTQMVAKGFDFGNLRLAAVLQADSLLSRPDYRGDEKAFQTLSQLKGRSGRRDAPSRFIIQTARPDHPVIQALCCGSHSTLLRDMLEERRAAMYPPYSREIAITLKDRNQERLLTSAESLYRTLYPLARRGVAAAAVSGAPAGASSGAPAGASSGAPAGASLGAPVGASFGAPAGASSGAFTIFPPLAPPVAMVAGEHRLCIRLLLPKDRRLAASKRSVLDAVRRFSQTYPGRITIDVDPA